MPDIIHLGWGEGHAASISVAPSSRVLVPAIGLPRPDLARTWALLPTAGVALRSVKMLRSVNCSDAGGKVGELQNHGHPTL